MTEHKSLTAALTDREGICHTCGYDLVDGALTQGDN